MIEKTCAVAVIGGGPAGISAATTAAQRGASVVLVDDSTGLGGHFYKELPEGFDGPYPKYDREHLREYRRKTENLTDRHVELINQARVWGIFRDDDPYFHVYVEHPEHHTIAIHTQALILAPGVYDRSIPFPGWELPGVMTPGAVQMALKKQGLLPGKRMIVCGTGPLQTIVAAALVEEGADVVALLDICGMLDGMHYMPGALGGLKSKFGEVFQSLQILVRNRVPILFHQAAFRALGNLETGVEGVVIGKVDPDGHPIPETERTLEVDTICISYGFAPSIAMTLHLGCKHVYEPNLGANIAWHDERMQTSLSGVFVAGDVTGVGGKSLADLQGSLAGVSALEKLGILSAPEAAQQRSQLDSEVRREKRFSQWLWDRYRIREGLFDLVDDDTLICRCENVTAGEIRKCLKNGARDLYGVKLRTRMGMGSCQGRYCMMNSAFLISRQTDFQLSESAVPSVRPPLTPIRLKNIAEK